MGKHGHVFQNGIDKNGESFVKCECGQVTYVDRPTPPVESLDSILAKFGLAFHKAMPSSVGGHREIRAASKQIRSLIQTSNRDVVLKQGVHHAAEMSILDQEIMSLKAEIKRLQTLTKEVDDGKS